MKLKKKKRKRLSARLTADARQALKNLVNQGRQSAHLRRHAQFLLLIRVGEFDDALIDREASEQVGCTRRTVEQIRERCVVEGLQSALEQRKQSRTRP